MAKKKRSKEEKHRQSRKKSASKPTSPVNMLRGAVGFRKEWAPLRKALDRVKEDAPPGLYPNLYGLAVMSPMLSYAYAASKPALRVEDVLAVQPLDPVHFYREVAWVVTVLERAAPLLQKFVPLREEYVQLLAAGEFGLASLKLNQIDKLCGPSFWSVETRIALLNLEGGFENQKAFIKAITTNHPRTYLAFFAANVGERNEARVTMRGFESRLRERAANWDLREIERDYLYYKLLGQVTDSLPKAASLLAYEGASSTVDLYETLIRVLCAVSASPVIRREQVLPLLLRLGLGVPNDHCIDHLRVAYGAPTSTSNQPSPRIFLEEFLRGDYERAAENVRRQLAGSDCDHLAIAVASKLRALGINVNAGPRSFAAAVIERLDLCNRHSDGADLAAEELEKLALNFRHLPVASSVAQDVRRAAPRPLASLTIESAVRQRSLTNDALDRLLQVSSANGKLPPIEIPAGELKSEDALAYHRISRALAEGDVPDDALIQVLNASGHAYFNREALVLGAWIEYRRGHLVEAIELSVNATARWPGIARELPLVEVIGPRGFRELKQIKDRLVLPIAFQMYIAATGDRSKEVALKVAWKQFLQHHFVGLPSSLRSIESQFSKVELVHFLRYVCIQDVMELGKAFSKPTDLDEERLKICVWLSELDQSGAEETDVEVLELTRRLSIEEGVRRVDSSRVYVDFFGLEKWAQEMLREPFLRYLDYVSAGLESSVAELEKRLVEALKRGAKSSEIVTFLDDIDLSADTILADLIERAAVAFMTLPRYGLDAFLGSRVRHGSLEGAFRSPLEHRRLVTKIESRTGEYEVNSYWSDLASDAHVATRIDAALRRFSRSVDMLIDGAVNRFVYVFTETNKDGLITIWPTERVKRQLLQAWVISVKISLTPSATITDFLSHCVTNFYWPALGQSLQVMRSFISDRLAGEILALLQGLDSEIKSFVPPERCGGFSNHIKAACSDVEAAAAKVSQWFVTPQQSETQLIFPLKSALEIGLQSTRRIHANFNPDVHWEVEPNANVILNPRAFEVVNDIAFLIFGNVARHSGYPQRGLSSDPRPGVDISIRLHEGDVVQMLIESDIGQDADESQIRASVAAAKASIAERRYDEVARRRRGTGLVRLASTLNYEGADDRTLDFGVTKNLRFFVLITAPTFYFGIDARNPGESREKDPSAFD